MVLGQGHTLASKYSCESGESRDDKEKEDTEMVVLANMAVGKKATSFALDRQELMDYLAYKQETRSTFDGRVNQQVEPIGYLNGKPIWPRILERVKSPSRVFFDEDNVAYETNERNLVDMLYKMDHDENYDRVMKFLDRFTN